MNTRSARNKETGKITVVVTDWNGDEFFRGDFDRMADADEAATDHERAMTIKMQSRAGEPLTMEEILMSEDELLAALQEPRFKK